MEAFLASPTSKLLQEALVRHNNEANHRPSWLEGWWDDAYLCGRDANAINVNYWFCFEDDPVEEKNSQVGRAASLLRGGMALLTRSPGVPLPPGPAGAGAGLRAKHSPGYEPIPSHLWNHAHSLLAARQAHHIYQTQA